MNKFKDKLNAAIEALDDYNDLVWSEFNRLLKGSNKKAADRYFAKIVMPAHESFNKMLALRKRVCEKNVVSI